MADLLIKGISDISATHDIHITNVGLNGVKEGFMAWDSSAGCAYEVVELPTHGRLVDWDEVDKCIEETVDCDIKQYALFLVSWAAEKRVVIEANEDGK